MKTLKWLDWPQWGLALGSDERYAPKWYEFRAYAMGLRDAARIVEDQRWKEGDIHYACRSQSYGIRYVKAIHARVLKVLGLPPDDRSGLE